MIIPDSAIGTMRIYSGDRGKCNVILRKIFLEVMFNFKRFSYVWDIPLIYFVALTFVIGHIPTHVHHL